MNKKVGSASAPESKVTGQKSSKPKTNAVKLPKANLTRVIKKGLWPFN